MLLSQMLPQTIVSPPPPKNSQKPEALRVLANKISAKKREDQAKLRIKCLLFRYLKEVNALENPRLLLITLQQILKSSDISGIRHRERILRIFHKPYKAKWEARLLKVASKALKEFIAANSEDLEGAA